MKSTDIWKSLISFLVAYLAILAGMSIPVIPKYSLPAAIAIVSFGCAAFYAWLYKPQRVSPQKYPPSPLLFVVFGCVAIALAVGAWISPPPAPTPAMWLGMLSGVLLGGILLAMSQGGKSN